MFRRLLNTTDRVLAVFSITVGWIALLLLCGLRVYEVVARQYVDSIPSGFLRFIESQAFVTMVLMALGYTYLRNNHVRVDIFRARLSQRAQAWFEIVGGVVVIVPFSLFVSGLYYPFLADTCAQGGPLRCAFGATVPLGLILLGLAGLIVIARNILFLNGREETISPQDPVPEPAPYENA